MFLAATSPHPKAARSLMKSAQKLTLLPPEADEEGTPENKIIVAKPGSFERLTRGFRGAPPS